MYSATYIAADKNGNLYISNPFICQVRNVDAAGIATTFAGVPRSKDVLGGSCTDGLGDGALAVKARLNSPSGIAVDGTGTVYILERDAQKTRKVSNDGTISTIAGTGASGRGGDGDGGPATAARLNMGCYPSYDTCPSAITFDTSGALLFIDFDRVRRIGTDGIIWTIAGGGTGKVAEGASAWGVAMSPRSIAVDTAGRLFLTISDSDHVFALTNAVGPIAPTISKVVDGATFTSAISPGEWATIQGDHLAGSARQWRDNEIIGGQLPTQLDGVSVLVGGKPAAIYYVSSAQINFQVPSDVVGNVPITVMTPTGSNTASTTVVPLSAQLFRSSGRYAAAQHADYSYVAKSGLLTGVNASPARPGETIFLYGTGCGSTNPPTPSGQVVTQPAALANTVRVTIGALDAQVAWAGISAAGLCQFDVVVPSFVLSGDAEVHLRVGNVNSEVAPFAQITIR